MYYTYYKNKFPKRVLVYIEEFDKYEGKVLFDFIDSNEYTLFLDLIGINYNLNEPSMVFLKNYKGKNIQENTIYAIRPETIQLWKNRALILNNEIDSFLIGYNIDIANIEDQVFTDSVSLNNSLDFYSFNYKMQGQGDFSDISFPKKGKVSVDVRNVGQGNWNEIYFDDTVKIIFDAGAPMSATKSEIIAIIGNRTTIYPETKPILILSHWDKDHYHSLIGMKDLELKNNFSAFICRDNVPNRTSRILFNRIKNAIGQKNTYCISAEPRISRGGPTYLKPLSSINKKVVLYNSQYHKNRNISGLLLTIKTAKSSVVLSGDAHYDQISRDILPDLNYKHDHNLVVPHHGGKAGRYNYNTSTLVTNSQAIISVGVNSYCHPIQYYITSLISSGFKVKQTKITGSDIMIAL